MKKRRQRGDDRIGYVCVCYTSGYWVCVWKGCPRAKGMGKHGETEFDTIDMDIWVFLVWTKIWERFLDRRIWEGEIDSWLLTDY